MTSRRRTWPMSSKRANSRIGTWFDHHVYSFVASLGRVLRKPWATALTVGVMAVALALPLGLWLVLGNVERFSGSVQQSREISVFLKQDVAGERATALAEELRDRRNVGDRSEEHTSELQSLMRSSYAVFCLKKKSTTTTITNQSKSNNTLQTLSRRQLSHQNITN